MIGGGPFVFCPNATRPIEALQSGANLLAETIDRPNGDPTRTLDDVIVALATILGPELTKHENARAAAGSADNATLYQLVRRGVWHFQRATQADIDAAEGNFQDALALSPENAEPLACVSLCLNLRAIRRWTADPPATFREAMDFARRAMAADPNYVQSRYVFALAHMNLGHREDAVTAFRETIAINPSHTAARANLGQVLNYLNRPDEALVEIETALRLSRHATARYQWYPYVAASHYLARRYRECLAAAQIALEANPEFPLAIRYAAAALGQSGRAAAAAPMLIIMRRADRGLANLEAMTRRLFVPAAAEHLLDGFRKAGFE